MIKVVTYNMEIETANSCIRGVYPSYTLPQPLIGQW